MIATSLGIRDTATCGRFATAFEHFERALTSPGTPALLARTKIDYPAALSKARAAALVRSAVPITLRLGMNGLARRAATLTT